MLFDKTVIRALQICGAGSTTTGSANLKIEVRSSIPILLVKEIENPIRSKSSIESRVKSDPRNGIRLCPICHKAIDDVYCPTILFYPTDLVYFYNCEIIDRSRQRRARAGTGAPVKRQGRIYRGVSLT